MEVTELLPQSLRRQHAAPVDLPAPPVTGPPLLGAGWRPPLAGWKREASFGSDAPGDPRKAPRLRPARSSSSSTLFSERRTPDFAFTAEAVAALAPDVDWVESPDEARSSSVTMNQGQADPDADRVTSEVRRIRDVGSSDYRRVLDLHPAESWDIQAVQSRYRQLMRLLHPDKRSKVAEARAGGREVCDEAVGLLLGALQSAKQELGAGSEQDPQRLAQQDMRRLQEMQRQRARQAMQRSQELQAGALAADIEKALASSRPEGAGGAGGNARQLDPTGDKIVGLLAQLEARTAAPPGAPGPARPGQGAGWR